MALKAVAAPLGSPVGGSGTPGTIPVWSSGTTLGDSQLIQSATAIYTTTRFIGASIAAARTSLHAYGPSATPPSAGTSEASIFIVEGSATNALKIGTSNVAPFGVWIQGYDKTTNSTQYPLLLNPVGGNVGIGTASPGATCDVHSGQVFAIRSLRNTGNGGLSISDTAGGIRLGTSTGTTGYVGAAIDIQAPATWTAGSSQPSDMRFFTVPSASTTLTERMRIASTGATAADSQVAIGTSSFATFTGGGVASLTTNRDVSVNGVRVGMGRGAVASNTAVGSLALDSNSTGTDNVAVGTNALRYTTGNSNTAVGFGSMAGTSGLSTHSDNVSIGFQSLAVVRSGGQNMASGAYALGLLQSGIQNVGVGFATLYAMVSTGGNTAIGHEAGRYVAGGGQVTQATDGVFLGRDARPNVDAGTNEVVIGATARGNGSNTVTIGNSSNVGTFLDTKYVSLVDSYTVGTLPVAGTAGRIARVTDGDAALAWGATVVNTGAGATPYLVWDNGTNWTVFGK